MDVKPIGQRVLISPMKAEEKTKGGIYIPDSASETPNKGKVVAVGDHKDITVKAGDIVIYDQYGTTDVKVDGVDMVIVKADSILAKLG